MAKYKIDSKFCQAFLYGFLWLATPKSQQPFGSAKKISNAVHGFIPDPHPEGSPSSE
jgi:hypothetical protein